MVLKLIITIGVGVAALAFGAKFLLGKKEEQGFTPADITELREDGETEQRLQSMLALSDDVDKARSEVSFVTGLDDTQIPTQTIRDLQSGDAKMIESAVTQLSRIAEQSNQQIDTREITKKFLNDPFNFRTQVSEADPIRTARLSDDAKRRERINRELAIPNTVKFSTSLAGSAKVNGVQIKRDSGFKGESITNFQITDKKSTFQQTLAREQARASAISTALFGNVQNPNFIRTKGKSEAQIRKEAEAQRLRTDSRNMTNAELDQIRANEAANRTKAAQQTIVGKQLQKIHGTTEGTQKRTLAAKGIKLNTGALNERALAKLRERGLI